MTEDEAMAALGHLVGGLNGFNDVSVDEYNVQFQKLGDAAALNEVCEQLAGTWTDQWRKPTVGEVIARYHAHPRVSAEREARAAAAALSEDGGRIVSNWGEGQILANDAYRALYGRNMGEAPVPNPTYAATLIENEGHRDRDGNWLCRYSDVLRGFRGDQARAQASLIALGRRLDHDNRGRLTLRPEPEPPTPIPTRSVDPTPPAEQQPAAVSGLLSAALRETRDAMEPR